jgi:hypothetical protein
VKTLIPPILPVLVLLLVTLLAASPMPVIQPALAQDATATPKSALDSIPDPSTGTDDPLAAYRAALPALRQAAGGKGCAKCFLDLYAPATFNKAYAVSPEGAHGGRWSPVITPEQAQAQALALCRKDKLYNPAHVWKP